MSATAPTMRSVCRPPSTETLRPTGSFVTGTDSPDACLMDREENDRHAGRQLDHHALFSFAGTGELSVRVLIGDGAASSFAPGIHSGRIAAPSQDAGGFGRSEEHCRGSRFRGNNTR